MFLRTGTEHDDTCFKNNEYTSLVHLHQVKSDVVNIVAVVSGRKPVKELSGGGKQCTRRLQYPPSNKTIDQQLTLHLVDESRPDKYDGFNVSLFAPPDHPDWLPDVQLGDSIILRSISVGASMCSYMGPQTDFSAWQGSNREGHWLQRRRQGIFLDRI